MPAANKLPDIKTVKNKIREVLRIKHYAYSTERTYIDWFIRFHTYVTGVKNKDWESESVDEKGKDEPFLIEQLDMTEKNTFSLADMFSSRLNNKAPYTIDKAAITSSG